MSLLKLEGPTWEPGKNVGDMAPFRIATAPRWCAPGRVPPLAPLATPLPFCPVSRFAPPSSMVRTSLLLSDDVCCRCNLACDRFFTLVVKFLQAPFWRMCILAPWGHIYLIDPPPPPPPMLRLCTRSFLTHHVTLKKAAAILLKMIFRVLASRRLK